MKIETSKSKNAKTLIHFQDLKAWQECRKLFFIVYRVTAEMPENERYITISQMRRAAMSAASNLAEGFGRESKSGKAHFYVMARGSLTELQNQAILAKDVGLMDDKMFSKIYQQSILAHKLTVGLIKSTKKNQ